jgi:hypothetical protein
MQAFCVHADTPYNVPSVRCGKAAFTRRTHGFNCLFHYRAQQEAIPAKPRKPQAKWKGYQPMFQSDDAIIKDIIRTDAQKIANGRVQEIRCGKYDPLVLRVLETVN